MIEILGIGDAIVDKLISFDESDPLMQPILDVKGKFFIATDEEHAYLRQKPSDTIYGGGSAANTLRNLAHLGMKTGFVGKVGSDEEARFFEKSLTDFGVNSFLVQTNQVPTGCCVVIVHTDKDRTQCSKPCASQLLEWADINPALLKSTKAVLTEGYMLNRQPFLIETVIRQTQKEGASVYFTLSDMHCVQNKRELLFKLMPSIDILFGNEYEFAALDMPDSLLPPVSVVTRGAQGADVYFQQKWFHFDTFPCTEIVNANGAGDAFAAGFLFKWHQRADLRTCVEMGHRIAATVLKSPLAYLSITEKIS